MQSISISLRRLASSLLRFDRYPGHVPVTSVAFSPDGHLLVSACPANSTMLVSHYCLPKNLCGFIISACVLMFEKRKSVFLKVCHFWF